MPMNRYEIRNEYSLADLQLYTTADKDDPEALLEGVAMAGLVGLLRQLGDLAEFAAEIFHDLHEEVMVAASRGHNLKARVQQLEAELPLIEKSFLSQTDHSSSLYNTGIDWHHNLRMDSNLVTRGDLPRFIMDSYEECRGPPRLFLLDKYDVAGDGACLKRYTDPSFFKLETSSTKMNGKDKQREKKVRKTKKKGTRLRNGGTPEALPHSHAKLHQLFMEEHAGNGERNPSRRVKLKRRLSGFPFDLKSGQSYMEKLLGTPPEPKVIHEKPTDDIDSDIDIHEVSQLSPRKDSVDVILNVSPMRDDKRLKPSLHEPELVSRGKIIEEDDLRPNISIADTPRTYDRVSIEKDVTVDEEKVTEDSFIGYLSDDISSELDNYVDAPMSMESEIDTDCELRMKNDCISGIKKQPTMSGGNSNKEQIHFNSLASQSTCNSVVSEDGIYACKKEMSRVSSFDQSSSVNGTKSENSVNAEDFPSCDAPGNEGSDVSSYRNIVMEDVPVARKPKSVVSGDSSTCPTSMTSQSADFEELISVQPCADSVTSIIIADNPVSQQTKYFLSDGLLVAPTVFTSCSADFEQLTAGQCHTDLDIKQGDCDSGVVLNEVILRGIESDENSSTLDEEAKRTNHSVEPACSPSFSDSDSRSGDSAAAMSSDFLKEDYSDQEDQRGHEQAQNVSVLGERQNENHLIDPACSFSVSDSEFLLGDNSPNSSSGGTSAPKSNSENTRCMPTVPDIISDPVISTQSSNFPLLDDIGPKNLNLGGNLSSMPSNCKIPPTATHIRPIFSAENSLKDEFKDGDQKLSENYTDNHPFNALDEDSFMLAFSKENPIYESDKEAGDTFHIVKEVDNTSPGNTLIIDTKEKDSDTSDFNHIGSPDSTLSHLECSQELPRTSLSVDGKDGVICDGEIKANETPEIEILKFTEYEISDNVSTHDSAYLESSSCATGNLELMEETADTGETGEGTLCVISNEQDANTISVTSTLASLKEVNVLPIEPDLTTLSDTVIVDSSLPADSAGVNNLCSSPVLDKLVEESSCAYEFKNGNHVPSLDKKELSYFEEVNERGVAPLGWDRGFSRTISNTHPSSQVSGPGHSDVHVRVERSSDMISCSTTTHSSQGIYSLAADQKADKICSINSNDAASINCQEDTGLPPYHQSLDYVEKDEVLRSLTLRDHQILDLTENKVSSSSSSKFSMLESPVPPVPLEITLQSGPQADVLGDRKPPLFSMFSFSNNLLDANSANMEELPPLPPLPPVQWRTGKVQLTPSITPTEPIQQEEFSVHGISAPFKSFYHVCSPHEELNHSQVEIDQPIAANEQKAYHSFSVEANVIIHEKNDLPTKKDNKQRGIMVSSPEIGLTLSDKEDVKTIPEIASRKEEVERSSASLDSSSLMKETVILKRNAENEKQELTIPSSDSESSMQAAEGGNANACLLRKLPLPRNPLIESVTSLDKSKLRKASDRILPELPKVEERDSILEQIRTRSFNLKPALTTRPSIRGPKTNLNVAAILEKANAIRQALADSDEDSWSDS